MTQPLRMLALVTDAFGAYGGIAQYGRDLLSAASQSPRVEKIVVLPRHAPFPLESLPPKLTQRAPAPSKIRYGIGALAAAVTTRPNIVLCGHLYHGPLALRIAQLTNAKLVSLIYGDEIWQGISPSHRLPLERSDLVISCSQDTSDRVVAATGIAPEKSVALFGTVGDDFTPGDRPDDRAAARRSFDIAEDETIVLTVARLDARADAKGYKGHDQVIPLIAQHRRAGLRVTYLIAGIGEDQARLEALAASEGISDNVRFLGKVPHGRLPDLYRAADLFALPSHGEGFGIVFVEAMACGTPAIGLAIGGAPDALGNGDLGRCVAPEDFPAAFAEELARCRDRDPTLPARVRARFGYPVFTRNALALIASLAEARVT